MGHFSLVLWSLSTRDKLGVLSPLYSGACLRDTFFCPEVVLFLEVKNALSLWEVDSFVQWLSSEGPHMCTAIIYTHVRTAVPQDP